MEQELQVSVELTPAPKRQRERVVAKPGQRKLRRRGYLVRNCDSCVTATQATLQQEKQETNYPGLILLSST